MGATVEAVGQFLLRAGAVIFVLWCVNYFLHDTIAETWHGMVRAVSQLAQLNPSLPVRVEICVIHNADVALVCAIHDHRVASV